MYDDPFAACFFGAAEDAVDSADEPGNSTLSPVIIMLASAILFAETNSSTDT